MRDHPVSRKRAHRQAAGKTSLGVRGALGQVSVLTTREAEEAVSEMLQGIVGTAPFSYLDLQRGSFTVGACIDFKPHESPGLRAKLREGLKNIQGCGINIGPGRVLIERVRRENWAESWKKHFKPLQFGADLLIKPDWSRRQPARGQAVVILNPGLSFGTGQHATTSFCLRQIVAARKKSPKQSFLDIGTGSGILAIAAAKLGYSPVHAFDYDPESVRIANHNARGNRLRIRVVHGDITKMPLRAKQSYSLVCANLIAPLLMTEHRRIIGRVAPGGLLVLAGILKSEFRSVQTIYETAGLKLVASKSEREWRSGAFLRSAKA